MSGADDKNSTGKAKHVRGRRWRWIVRAVAGLLLVVLALAAYLTVSRLRASREARAKLAVIADAGLPTTRQEARQYYLSLQSGPDLTSKWRATVGMLDDTQFSEDYRELFEDADLFPVPGHGRQSLLDDMVRLEEFIAKYPAIVEAVHETAKNKGYVDFFDFEKATHSAEFFKIQTACRLLAIDAVVAIHRGDSDRLLDSAEGMFRMGHLLDNEPLLVAQLTRQRCVGLVVDVVHHSLSRTQLSPESMTRLMSQLAELDQRSAFRRGAIAERAVMTACFRDLHKWEYADRLTWQGHLRVRLNPPGDLCFYLDHMASLVDALAESPEAELADWTELESPSADVPPISATVLPAGLALMTTVRRVTFETDACRVGLAIEGYRTKHSRMPKSLEDLVPEFLERVPADPFEGEPLRYKPIDNGYRIYSVGGNGVDDAGEIGEYLGELDYVFEVPRPVVRTEPDSEYPRTSDARIRPMKVEPTTR